MVKSAAFQLGCDCAYLEAVTPNVQFFEKMAAKLDVDPLLLMAAFNKQAFEKTAFLPFLLGTALTAAPALYELLRSKKLPYKYPYGFGRGLPSMSSIGGLDPKAMSDITGYGAQLKALGAQNQMINRMFQPQPVY